MDLANMNAALAEDENRVVVDFCNLLERSRQLFNGLRTIPQYGQNNWHDYFGRAFDTLSRLWKFQQQYRPILDTKYGLKRWQIGEMASKIGQLYYHYYLRTSETNLLNEAFSFYSAIRDRCYYTNAADEETSDLMVKKLRYYSRFIIVCILLNKTSLCKQLLYELDNQVMDYAGKYHPTDKADWIFLIHEVRLFLHADSVINITPSEGEVEAEALQLRLTPLSTPSIEKLPVMNLVLEEVLIVGCYTEQVKVSEMTMDMKRMIQVFEREPESKTRDIVPIPRTDPNSPEPIKMKGCLHGGVRRAPHKNLLYQPTISQLLMHLSSCCNELSPNGVFLFYISAEGWMSPGMPISIDVSYERGGVLLNNSETRDGYRPTDRPPYQKKERCLCPGDILPLTRQPLVVIIESDNGNIFQYISRPFSQPLLILMAPSELPPYFHSHQHNGSLFSFFLHQPILAFLHVCDVTTINSGMLSGAQHFIDSFFLECYRRMTRCRSLDPTFLQLFGDEFLRLVILRHIFCSTVLHMHVLFRDRSNWPRSSPTIPENDILIHPTLVNIVLEMAAYFELSAHFHDPVLPF